MEQKERIVSKLRGLEERYGFHILLACESGSRAWGFASADSDYDVRFVFVWPQSKYLRVIEPRQTFDFGIDEDLIDLSGWEFRKSLGLFRKTNGALFEWLHSPISYFEEESVVGELRRLAADYFVPAHSLAHYLGMSGSSWERISASELATAKAYLYTIRSILAGRYALEKKAPVPVLFSRLCEKVELPDSVRKHLVAMISEKSKGEEGDTIPRVPILDEFILEQRSRLAAALSGLDRESVPVEPLDELFQRTVSRYDSIA